MSIINMEATANALKHELGAVAAADDDHQFVVEFSSGSEETSKVKNGSRVLHELSVLSPPAGISSSRLSPQQPSAAGQTPIPNYETALRRRRRRSLYPCSKPRSRLVEPPHPRKAKVFDQDSETIPLTATMGSTGGEEYVGGNDDDDDDVHVDVDEEVYVAASGAGRPDDGKKHGKKVKFLILMEWITFFSMLGFLIASLCINKLKDYYILGLNIWKWCLLILVVFCGHLVTQWLMDVLEFFIKRNFLLKKRVLYFLYGVKRSVRVFVWLGLILLTWVLLINRSSRRTTTTTTRVLNYITRGIGCSLLGAFLWMSKDFLVKLLAASFHVKTFFERIQESIFHQYVLQVLSSRVQYHQQHPNGTNINKGKLRIKQSKKNSGEEIIQVDKLTKVKKEKVSAWTMSGLIKTISSSGLSVISELLVEHSEGAVAHKEIRSEFEAKAAAKHIFRKVAKTSNEYIEEQDLLQYMSEEEVDLVLMMFEDAAETGKIKKKDFKSWVVKVYQERKHLKYSLKDSKTAIEELNRIVTVCLVVIIIIAWLILMGIITTRVLVFITSQLLLVVFIFGNTAKTLFECLVFVFITHPFDIGDKCVIDGVQMAVDEMNILTTNFLRYDNEIICYPNSVLATKPIGNFNRSPEMGDSVEFSVDFSTSFESIAALKARIKKYVESKPQHWRPGHSVTITAIEDMNKLKMEVGVTHTVNFQNTERGYRRSELVLELKRIFEDLGIKYHLPPQELQVHLRNVAVPDSSSST